MNEEVFPGWLENEDVADEWSKTGLNGKIDKFEAESWPDLVEKLYGDSKKKGLLGEDYDEVKDQLAHKQHEEAYADYVCSSYGTTLGRTQTFVSAVYCEMLRAYTVRCAPGDGSDPPWAWRVFNRNFTLHIACQISFWTTIAVTIIPWLNKNAFHAQPLTFPGYVVACFFPVVNMIMDEIVPKPLYKMIVQPHKNKGFVDGPPAAPTYSSYDLSASGANGGNGGAIDYTKPMSL
jgi:hypothetical protein